MDSRPGELFLDVRELEPCEPMEQALEACSLLKPGEYIHMLHRQEPHLLYPILAERGFAWRAIAAGESEYHIHIWHKGDVAAEHLARQAGH